MKKPVILLLHPFPAVRERLQAAVSPIFSQVCRIEAFETPEPILSSAEEWAKEKRPVAVVVLPRKTVNFSLQNFLENLQKINFKRSVQKGAFYPAEHMQTLFLEEGDAIAGGLMDTLRERLRDYLIFSGTQTHYVFREVTTVNELEEILKKRYQVYKNTSVAGFIVSNIHQVDLDAYDLNSFHFGLFEEKIWSGSLVGCIRLATESRTPTTVTVSNLAQSYENLKQILTDKPEYPLPLLRYKTPQQQTVNKFYHQFRTKGETVTEPGRFCLDDPQRTLPVARFVANAVAGFWFAKCFDHAILTCGIRDKLIYLPLGFQPVPDTVPYNETKASQELMWLFLSKSTLPPKAEEKLALFAERFKQTQNLCHCPSYPDCQPGPYVTGDFAEVDVFCPLKAKNMVLQSAAVEPATARNFDV